MGLEGGAALIDLDRALQLRLAGLELGDDALELRQRGLEREFGYIWSVGHEGLRKTRPPP